MSFFVVRMITAIIPPILLPTGVKSVNGVQKNLNTQERREYLERTLTHHIDQILNKYSPIRRTIKAYREQRLKQKKNEFYCLIGQIALIHAGIEHDLKNTLMVDWGAPENFTLKGKKLNLDYLYGRKLRIVFLEILAELLVPSDKLKEYEMLCDEFRVLSEKRNDTVKAIYSFNQDTAVLSKIHEKNHGKYYVSMNYEEYLNSWMPKIDVSESKDLCQALVNLRQKFMNVRGSIFVDKIRLQSELCSEIGKTYPASAFTNPYMYRASLRKEDTALGKNKDET